MGRRCAIKGCICKPKCLPLYCFPIGDYVRCLKWLRASGQTKFLELPFVQLGSRYVCKCHFEKWAPTARGKLYAGAYPTQLLPQQISNQYLRIYCAEQNKLAAFEKLIEENNDNDNVANETLTNEVTQLSEVNIDESSVIPPSKPTVVDANPTHSILQEISNQDLRRYYEMHQNLAVFGNFGNENNDDDNVNEQNFTSQASSQQCEMDIAETSVITTNIKENLYDSTVLKNMTPQQKDLIAKYHRIRPSIATVRASKRSLWTKLKLPNDKIYYHPIMQIVLTKLIQQANTIKNLQHKNRIEKQKYKKLISPKNNKTRSGHEKK